MRFPRVISWASLPERSRQALIAIAISVVVGLSTLLEPIDRGIWILQSQMFERSASGDIVVVGLDRRVASGADEARLKTTISRLENAGAARIFLDLDRTDAPKFAARDESRVFVIERQGSEGAAVDARGLESPAPRDPQDLARYLYADFLGIVWNVPAFVEDSQGRVKPEFSSVLADRELTGGRRFIDYSIQADTVPTYRTLLSAGPSDAVRSKVTGKDVVITDEFIDRFAYDKLPGQGTGPSTMISVLAAETIKAGGILFIPWAFPLLAAAIFLFCATFLTTVSGRRAIYGGVIAAGLLGILLSAYTSTMIERSGFVALLASYALLRIVARYKRRHLLVDRKSGLPNLAALERDLAEDTRSLVVVMQVNNIERLAALATESGVAQLYRTLASRFVLGHEDATVYTNGGKLLATRIGNPSDVDYVAHFQSLRDIIMRSVDFDGQRYDVSAVFGIEAGTRHSPSERIAGAIAAVDRADPVYRPVVVNEIRSDEEEKFSLSLRARLEAALETGEIRTAYQPKIDLASGEVKSAEALARWTDVERGHVPPSVFIEQCERAGRIDQLTRHILTCAAHAAIAIREETDRTVPVAVNISSILLGRGVLVSMVRDVIGQNNLPASMLMLEFTETAKVGDYQTARMEMRELQRMGIALSLDDFGVGEANLETLLELPFDEVKVDRLFVSRLSADPKACAMVHALVEFGRLQNIEIVAEGIEDRDTARLLLELGCRVGQGYALGRPMELTPLIAAIRRPSEEQGARIRLTS